MRILHITSFIPKRNATQAGVNVSFDFINTLKSNIECEIDVVGLVNEHQFINEELEDIKPLVNTVEFIKINRFQKIKNIILNFDKPALVSVRYDSRLKKKLSVMLSRTSYDYVICDYTQNSQYGYLIKEISPNTKVVLVEHDVSFQGLERKMEFSNNILKKKILKWQHTKLKSHEINCIRDFDETITLNSKDYNIISKYGKVSIINPYINIMDLDKKEHEGINLMFWGAMNRIENEDAVKYFINDIWPYVNKENVKFYIVGSNPSDSIRALESDNIIVTGFVENPKDIFENMDISVVPLRLGAGIKIKVLESLAAGLPVITTDVGVEGISVENNDEIIVENDPKVFAERINSLVIDDVIRERIASKGKESIRSRFSKEYNIEVLKSIFK